MSFTAEPSASVACSLTGPGAVTLVATAGCASSAGFDLAGQPDGEYHLSLTATDAAGNSGPAATADFVLDTTPPSVPVLSAIPRSPSSAQRPSWSFTAESGAS